MKKLILSLALASFVFLSGCSAVSVGIIGGADGPTAVYVNDNEYNTNDVGVRMVNIDGSLYYDSGKVSEVDARCGNMDGELVLAAELPRVPHNSGEANFKPDYGTGGYQRGAEEDTVEIFVDGAWHIFNRITEDEKDISGYEYCLKLSGTMPNAESESRFIVLTDIADLTFERAAKSLYSSFMEDGLDIYIVSTD